jgi:membrane fusion protein, multidrug efflux system
MTRKYFILLLLFGAACTQSPQQQRPPVSVSATQVMPQTIPANFEYVGVAESSHIVELRARVEGYLEKISYDEGSFVEEGTLMFVLDQRPFIASLASAEGDLARQKAILWNAQQTKARMLPLYQQNAVSQKDLDSALSDELSSEASVMTAQANVETARLNLEFASITAPVSGMTNQAKYREGALIGSSSSDSLLTTMYVVDPIWVNFSVSSGDILKSRKEAKKGLFQYPPNMKFSIEIVLADGTILPADGVIDFADPSLQQSTGTMLVRSVLPNPDHFLQPGQFARVIVKGATRPNATIVPQTAVLQGQCGTFVYLVKEGKAAICPVELGDWYKNFWIINSGLSKGDIVITEGINRVQNGSAVTIKTWVSDTPSEEGVSQDRLGLE